VGQAAAGFLCVYQGGESGANTPINSNIFNPETGGGGTSRRGFAIFLTADGAGSPFIGGTWTVTGA
jgi:hypothetical protein